MNAKRENVVHLYPERESVPVTHLNAREQQTVGKIMGKTYFSIMNAMLFSVRKIVAAIVSLLTPILYMIIGLWAILSYLLFGIAGIALFVVNNLSEALGLMGISVGLFLLCKMFAYVVILTKIKLG